MIFFTADTHFGHGGALGLYRRPFAGVPAMDAAMTERWNATVGPDDEVWHLGDVAVGPRSPGPAAAFAERLGERLAGLNGRKHLVTGNNDPDSVRSWPGWQSVQAYAEITVEAACWCYATTPCGPGTAWPARRSICTGIAMGGWRRCRGNSMSGWMCGTSDLSHLRVWA